MGDRKQRLARPAALSAVALASVVGAPSASAQEVCITCPPGQGSSGFLKIAALGFPGSTEYAFLKIEGVKGATTAFLKLTQLGFPGNTEQVFDKFRKD